MNRIATIGFFDGVHKGHRYLFKQLDRMAAERNLEPLIVTFEQHPREVLQADYVPQLLTSTEERRALLSAYGQVLMMPFAQIQALTAAQFMEFLHTKYDVSVLLMGYDHRFGSDRLSKPQEYRMLGEKIGIEVLTDHEFVDGEYHVSSTEIRTALENGNIAVANDLLGRPYSLRGTVVHGKGLGRTIGFPTANIEPNDPNMIIPKPGVYAVQARAYAFEWTSAIMNIGEALEVYIPNFQGDLYHQALEVRFMRFLRNEKQMSSLDELQSQIKEDLRNIHVQCRTGVRHLG
ncbi:MAG: riboflavin biosynthesis protein RibF [Paludibacteraceae bacterium]|nr:riboflavin biosynthesis protein RibF [Paludibacteraceae bacterium]